MTYLAINLGISVGILGILGILDRDLCSVQGITNPMHID